MKSLWHALRKRCRFFKYNAATYKISQDDIQDDDINKPKKLHQIGVNSYYKPAISIFLPNLNGGGAEKNILTLLEYFVKQNISVDLVCTSHYGALREKVPRGVRYIVLDSGRVILSIPRYISYLALARPQVVLSTLERANIVACIGKLLSSNKHKLVLRIENSIFEPTIRPREIGRIFWILLIVLFYRFADEYICISHGLKRQMESLIKNRCNNITTIYNPVMNQALRRELIERIQPIDEIYPGELKVIAVGRLEPQKDYVTLLEAFAIVRRATPCRLIILGEGSEREKLERLAEELGISGSVDMKGYVQFPIKYVRQCNVFVLTSRWEGFGNVLVEALATGIQVVSTDCPHGPREILGGGKFGKLIPTADKEAVALEVLQALGSTRTTSDMDELAMHLGQFNAERIAEQYLLAIAPEVPR